MEQTTEKSKDKIHFFILHTPEKQDIVLVNEQSLEEAIPKVQAIGLKQSPSFRADYMKSMEVNEFMDILGIQRIVIKAVEEPSPKPTMENLAQMLRDNGYIVTKNSAP